MILPSDLIGQLEGFPIEVVERMVQCQVEQGNAGNVSIFQNKLDTPARFGGFDWNRTKEGVGYWNDIINRKKLPKVETSYTPEFGEVVLCTDQRGNEGERVYLGTIEGAKYPYLVCTKRAFDLHKRGESTLQTRYGVAIKPVAQQKVRLTLKDISEGKGIGIDPDLIEIVK